MEVTRNITVLLETLSKRKSQEFWESRSEVKFDLRGATGGRFEYVRELGAGGMGRVLLARDTTLVRHVAIKVLEFDQGSGENADAVTARFLREARITAGLVHPGVVPVYDLGCSPDGQRFFIMQVIGGVTLAELFAKTAEKGVDRCAYISHFLGTLSRVCQTVGYAHYNHVMHLDLKPDNIKVGSFGEVIVLDWGAALTRDEIDEAREAKQNGEESPGSISGTPRYMAPEQFTGDITQLSPATDVFALGVLLYEVLTGCRPFERKGYHELRQAVMSGDMLPVREAVRRSGQQRVPPKELMAICEKTLAVDPADRYADARPLGEDLLAYLENRAVRAFHGGWLTRTKRRALRYRTPVLVGISVASLLFLAGATLWSFQRLRGNYVQMLEKQTQVRREHYMDRRRELDWLRRQLEKMPETDSPQREDLSAQIEVASGLVNRSAQHMQLALATLLTMQEERPQPVLVKELRRLWLRNMQEAMHRGEVEHVRESFEHMATESRKVTWWRWEPDEFEAVEEIRNWLREQEKPK